MRKQIRNKESVGRDDEGGEKRVERDRGRGDRSRRVWEGTTRAKRKVRMGPGEEEKEEKSVGRGDEGEEKREEWDKGEEMEEKKNLGRDDEGGEKG